MRDDKDRLKLSNMNAQLRKLPLLIILILNVVIYLGWTFASTEDEFRFMVNNFLVSMLALIEGRVWTLLTSVFSHATFFHLLFNMMALSSFSFVMIELLGSLRFILFYLTAGLAGSIAHVASSTYLMHDPSMNALGASGAVSGIILLFSLVFPQQKLLILGLIPVRAIWGAVLLVSLDVWGLITQTRGTNGLGIGHGAHLGGAIVGILYFFYLKNRSKKIATF